MSIMEYMELIYQEVSEREVQIIVEPEEQIDEAPECMHIHIVTRNH